MRRIKFVLSAAGIITAALFLPRALAAILLIGYIAFLLSFSLFEAGSGRDGA